MVRLNADIFMFIHLTFISSRNLRSQVFMPAPLLRKSLQYYFAGT